MPKSNPKWDKARLSRNTTIRSSDAKTAVPQKCCVSGCGKPKKRIVTLERVNAHASTLDWKIIQPKKSKKVALCKDHYSKFAKLENKEDKWKKMRDYTKEKSKYKPSKQREYGFD